MSKTTLTEDIQALFDSCKAQLEAQGTWQDTDSSLLDQYASAVVRSRVIRREAEEEPWVEGSKGQKVAHPGFKIAKDDEEAVLKYAKELLLTPKQRKSAGVANAEDGDETLEELLA